MAVQLLSSGDKRVLYYRTNGQYPVEIIEYSLSEDSRSDREKRIHISDAHYLHGASFVPQGNQLHHAIYAERSRQGELHHTIVHTKPLLDSHVGWTMVPTDEIVRHSGAGVNTTILSGLLGLSRVLGVDENKPFLWISIERYDTTVAIVRGGHVSMHSVIPAGTSHLVQQLTHILGSDEVFARTILEKHGLLYTHHEKRIRDALIECLSPIVELIHNVQSYVDSASYKNRIDRDPVTFFVCGGVGVMTIPGMGEYLETVVHLPRHKSIHPHYQRLIQGSKAPITKASLPKYYVLLGLTAL
jgi:hypothetical protein